MRDDGLLKPFGSLDCEKRGSAGANADHFHCADLRGPDTTRHRIDRIVQLLGCANAAEAADRLGQMLDLLQCPRRLRDVGITTDEQVRALTAQVNAERLANNPRRIPAAALSNLLSGLI